MKSPRWTFSEKKPARPHSDRRTTAVQRSPQATSLPRSVLLAYLDTWRTAADDVEAASHGWRTAPTGRKADAARAFFAALDREQTAAAAYQHAWES